MDASDPVVGYKRAERWAAPDDAPPGAAPTDGSEDWALMDQLMWCNHKPPTARVAASLLTRLAATRGVLRGGARCKLNSFEPLLLKGGWFSPVQTLN